MNLIKKYKNIKDLLEILFFNEVNKSNSRYIFEGYECYNLLRQESNKINIIITRGTI